MILLDPLELARAQLAADRKRTNVFSGLFERKARRMSASPLAFLRGAAPLFYDLLKDRPPLAEGPGDLGWITGDMHLENFGAYRPDPRSFSRTAKDRGEHRATFDLNDFDEAVVAPLHFDVLRLTTSLILGGRELGADGGDAIALCGELLDAYVGARGGKRALLTPPPPVAKLIRQVETRTRAALLDRRTEAEGKRRRFLRDESDRYRDLPARIRAAVPAAFTRYARELTPADRPDDERAMEVVDAALRIAGTGSLGCLRIAVLVRGKGGRGMIFDMKEQNQPAAGILVGTPDVAPAARVVAAVKACLDHPPRMLGTTTLGGKSMFVRRLAPQEDKLELTRTTRRGDLVHAIHHDDLAPLAAHLGALLGRAHRRGALRRDAAGWKQKDCETIIKNAITIAGIHEAVYLAYCKLASEQGLS